MRGRCVWGLLVLGLLAVPDRGRARDSDEVLYRFEQVWSATVRLVRVDYRFPIRDSDEEVGYLLFDYKDDQRSYPGSFEVLRVREGRRQQVRVVLSIPSMPGYIERMMLDKLKRKLEQDFGEPPPPPPRREEDGREGDGREGDGEEDRGPEDERNGEENERAKSSS